MSAKEQVLAVYPEAYAKARASGMIDIIDCRDAKRALAIGCGKSDAEAWPDASVRTGLATSGEDKAMSAKPELPATLAAAGYRDLLLLEERVREAEVDLAGAIPAKLSAEGALDDEVGAGELGDTGWNGARALLAGDHVVGGIDLPLLAIVHAHELIL